MQTTISHSMQLSDLNELSDEEVNRISGGNILVIAAGVAAAFGALGAAESFGQRIGKALYHATH